MKESKVFNILLVLSSQADDFVWP